MLCTLITGVSRPLLQYTMVSPFMQKPSFSFSRLENQITLGFNSPLSPNSRSTGSS